MIFFQVQFPEGKSLIPPCILLKLSRSCKSTPSLNECNRITWLIVMYLFYQLCLLSIKVSINLTLSLTYYLTLKLIGWIAYNNIMICLYFNFAPYRCFHILFLLYLSYNSNAPDVLVVILKGHDFRVWFFESTFTLWPPMTSDVKI